jgi:hypothetical protein
MDDFVSVLADYLSVDVILTFLTRLEQMEPYPYEWESLQAKELSKRLLQNTEGRSPGNLEAFKRALKNRPSESIEGLLEKVQSGGDNEGVIRFGYAINRFFSEIIDWEVDWVPLETFISRQFRLPETFHTFITFNYDLLLERAVEKLTSGEWEASRGYGFRVDYGIMDDFSGLPSVQAVELPASSTSPGRIEILKPHGSLNWLVPLKTPYTPDDSTGMRFENGPVIIPVTSEVELRYSRFTPKFNRVDLPGRALPCDVLPCIVPPVSRKSSNLSFFEEVRKREQEAIKNADEIYVLGWSVPKTDQEQESLIQNAVADRSKSPPAVTVVNRRAKPEYFERVACLLNVDKDKLNIFNAGFGDFVAEVCQV